MNDIYIIGAVVLLVIAGLFVVPFLKNKGLLTSKNISSALKFIDVKHLVIDILPIADKYKDKANFVLNVADEVVDYVNTYANGGLSKDDKITLSLRIIDSICAKYGIEPSVQEVKLIEIIVKQSIEFAGKIGK